MNENGDYFYQNPNSDEALLHTISPHLITLREDIISSIDTSCTRIIQKSNTHDIPARNTLVSHERHLKLTAESLADLWSIGLKRAQDTLNATTQRYTRSAILPIARRYRADRMYNVK